MYGYDPEGPSPSEEDNNVVVEPISLDKRHSIECYVLDVVDPLTQSTQLSIDLYIHALDLVRDIWLAIVGPRCSEYIRDPLVPAK